MAKTFFITTAIDYTNSAPHIGHAYEKILADVIARYHRLKGENVFFLTGVDQHGQKVQQSAEREGVPPEQFVAGVTEQFIALWDKLDVRYDAWAATTDPLHKKCVQGMLQRLFDEGKIYKDKQVGFYSVRQEQFLTDKDRNEAGEFGPEWGEVEQREEENYYFKLSEHKEWLLNFLRSHPTFVSPSFRQTELINAVEKLSGDLCISRPKSRLSWGIELPFDRDYVNYVWFDALDQLHQLHRLRSDSINHQRSIINLPRQMAGATRHRQGHHDSSARHLLANHAARSRIPRRANADAARARLVEYLRREDEQESGNVVDPDVLVEKYGAEALRYYLMSDIVTGKDADFSKD